MSDHDDNIKRLVNAQRRFSSFKEYERARLIRKRDFQTVEMLENGDERMRALYCEYYQMIALPNT